MKKLFCTKAIILFITLWVYSCKVEKKEELPPAPSTISSTVAYAKGFTIQKTADITIIRVTSPWPGAETTFTYALVPKEKAPLITLNAEEYDAIISVPVERIIVTSTTHIPALEALGALHKLVGFPQIQYISSNKTQARIQQGLIQELGINNQINTEMALSVEPDVVFGFGIDAQNSAYQTLQTSGIPVVYNGDWVEETPLGKAEWIKFFAPFFEKEKEAKHIFATIENNYLEAKTLAKNAISKPTVLSGSLYKDVWHLPGGNSWAAQFLEDAHAEYIWNKTPETGSLSLSIESVLEKAKTADFWISPSQFTTYSGLKAGNVHYTQFDAFEKREVYTFALTKGSTGGIEYYELGPSRPDLILKDLIHIFHPELLPSYKPYFFKPLQ